MRRTSTRSLASSSSRLVSRSTASTEPETPTRSASIRVTQPPALGDIQTAPALANANRIQLTDGQRIVVRLQQPQPSPFHIWASFPAKERIQPTPVPSDLNRILDQLTPRVAATATDTRGVWLPSDTAACAGN